MLKEKQLQAVIYKYTEGPFFNDKCAVQAKKKVVCMYVRKHFHAFMVYVCSTSKLHAFDLNAI